MIIAIDGPSGSGKSTISKLIAKKLNLIYIDTGAIYRSIALIAMQKNADLNSSIEMGKLAGSLKISFKFENNINHVFNAEDELTDKIRTPEVSMAASKISAYKEVRSALLGLQRSLGYSNNSILEGRDIGTIVFPDADYKFFLNANTKERAKRRFLELKEKGNTISIDEVEKQIIERDKNDESRETAPLVKAKDAIEIDSTGLSIEGVVNKILSHIKTK